MFTSYVRVKEVNVTYVMRAARDSEMPQHRQRAPLLPDVGTTDPLRQSGYLDHQAGSA